MLADKQLEQIALFFYFTFLDESRAHNATIKTIKKLKNINLIPQKKEEVGPFFVSLTQQMAASEKSATHKIHSGFFSGYLTLPEKSNWGPWFEFKKTANENDFQAVLYFQLLGLSEEDIAKGLKVSEGTIRYRIGRGLKILGAICGERRTDV